MDNKNIMVYFCRSYMLIEMAKLESKRNIKKNLSNAEVILNHETGFKRVHNIAKASDSSVASFLLPFNVIGRCSQEGGGVSNH